jgi:flagellar assembly protein FliH
MPLLSRLIKKAPVDATCPYRLEARKGFSPLNSLQAEPVLLAAAKAAEAEAAAVLEAARKQAREIKAAATQEADALRQEATRSGYETGFEAGYQDGLAEAAGIKEESKRIMEEALRYRQEIFVNLQPDLVAVAVVMAERIIRQEVSLEPGLIAGICREALKKALDGSNYLLSVHPDLLPVVEAHRQQLEQCLPKGARMQIIPEATLQPGGCRLETETIVVHGDIHDQLSVLHQALQTKEER